MDFYFIVSILAIIILIIVLTAFGIMMQKKYAQVKYPEYALDCPDYWTLNTNKQCVLGNVNLGDLMKPTFTGADTPGINIQNKSIDFKHAGWSNTSTITGVGNTWNPYGIRYDVSNCALKAWSKYYKVQWDGISNSNVC